MKPSSQFMPSRRWLRCRGADSSDLEPYALVQVVGAKDVGGRAVVDVKSADRAAGFTRPLAALGPARLRPGEFGHCTMQWPAWVRTTGVVQAGAIVGPLNSHAGKVGPVGQGFLAHSAAVGEPSRALVSVGPQYFRAKKIRFDLGNSVLKTTDIVNANATAADRWDGRKPPQAVVVPVWNLPLSQDYMFSGGPDQFGLASYDIAHELYWILTTECPS